MLRILFYGWKSYILKLLRANEHYHLKVCGCCSVAKLCPTLCYPIECITEYTFVRATDWASQVMLVVKNPSANAGDMRCEFNPWVGKIPWRRAQRPTLVFLSGESHGQRNLVSYSPQSCKELCMTEGT